MVHVATKYAIGEDDVELLPKNKKIWWLKSVTDDGFVNIPTIACTEPVDIDIDIGDGEYILGCGDWNVTNDAGKHISQRNYFYINDGHIHYVKKMADLPSKGGATQTSWGGNSWGKKSEQTPVAKNEPQYAQCPMCVLCVKGTKKAVNFEDYEIIAQNCGDFDIDIPSDGDRCDNCKNKVDLFIEVPKN